MAAATLGAVGECVWGDCKAVCVRTALVGCSWYLLLSPNESHDNTTCACPRAQGIIGKRAWSAFPSAARGSSPPCQHLQAPFARERSCSSQWRLAGRFRGGEIAQGRACAVWLQVDAPELSLGPGWEIQEVSRLGAQGVTSKSKVLAREMPRVRRRGLRVDSGGSLRRKVAVRGQAAKSMRRSSP